MQDFSSLKFELVITTVVTSRKADPGEDKSNLGRDYIYNRTSDPSYKAKVCKVPYKRKLTFARWLDIIYLV